VVQNRALHERTQHTQNAPVNASSIAVAVAGNRETDPLPDAQRDALRSLVLRLDATHSFEQIIPHRDASPSTCPGEHVMAALSDLWRSPGWEVWNITRYYTPVKGQRAYYRKVSDKDFIHRAVELGLVEEQGGTWQYSYASGWQRIGFTLEEADQWFKDRPEHREAIRKEMEYMLDFRVNCHGNCLSPADGGKLYTDADAFRVLACPPEYPLGTRFEIEGIGELVCRDRGGAIKDRRLDVWAGVGDAALSAMRKTPGGSLRVRVLP
jgi:3D (Asp-Asp-Asp) domain-containing protein